MRPAPLSREAYAWTARALGSLEHGAIGRRGELLCVELLEAQGFRVLARRLRTPQGEVDVVARRGGALWCIEVKSTRASPQSSAQRFAPRTRLSVRQRQRLERAAVACGRTLGEPGAPGLALFEVWLDARGALVDWRVTTLRQAGPP